MQLWDPPLPCTVRALDDLTDAIIYSFLCAFTKCELICRDSLHRPWMCEGKPLIQALLDVNLLNCTEGVTQQVESSGFLHNKRHMRGGGKWEGRRESRFPTLFKGELKYMYWVGAVIKRNGWGDAGWEQIWKAVEDGGKVMEHHRRIGWNYLFIIRGLLHGCLLHCPVTDEAALFKWAFHSPPLG